jgi:hypothetical protein
VSTSIQRLTRRREFNQASPGQKEVGSGHTNLIFYISVTNPLSKKFFQPMGVFTPYLSRYSMAGLDRPRSGYDRSDVLRFQEGTEPKPILVSID